MNPEFSCFDSFVYNHFFGHAPGFENRVSYWRAEPGPRGTGLHFCSFRFRLQVNVDCNKDEVKIGSIKRKFLVSLYYPINVNVNYC